MVLNTKAGGTILSSKLRKGAMHAFCFTSVRSGQELDDGYGSISTWYKTLQGGQVVSLKNGFLVLNPLIGNKSLLIVQEVESK